MTVLALWPLIWRVALTILGALVVAVILLAIVMGAFSLWTKAEMYFYRRRRR